MAVVETIEIRTLFNNKDAEKGIKKLNKSLKNMQKGFGKQFSKLLKFAGFAGFTKMAIDAAAFGRSMGLLADKTGIAVDRLTSMRNAFSAVGGDAKNVDALLSNITSGLARLSMGDGEFAAKLSSMGISAWDNKGNVKKADVIMGDLADWTKSQLEMGRSMAEVSTFLHDNFGIEQDLVNQLALGRAGMEAEIKKQNERTGNVSGLDVANLESLNKSFATLKTTIGILVDKIMAGLAPVIEFLSDLLTIFFKELQDVFGELFGAFSDVIGGGEDVAELFKFLKNVIRGVIDALKLLADGVALLLAAFKWLGDGIGKLLAYLRNSWIGKKVFGESGASNNLDTMAERIAKQEKEGKITHEQANALRKKLGIGQQDNLFVQPQKPKTKDLITGKDVYLDGTPVIENAVVLTAEQFDAYEKESFPDEYVLTGNEVVIADKTGATPIVNLDVKTEAKFDEATGQIEQNIDVNGQSEGGSGVEPINYMFQTVNGGA